MIRRYKLKNGGPTPIQALQCTCNTHFDLAKKWVGEAYCRGNEALEILTLIGWKPLKESNFLLSANSGEFFIMESDDFYQHYQLDRRKIVDRLHIKPKTEDFIALQFTGFNAEQVIKFTGNACYIYENPIVGKDILMVEDEQINVGDYVVRKPLPTNRFELLRPWEFYNKFTTVRPLTTTLHYAVY